MRRVTVFLVRAMAVVLVCAGVAQLLTPVSAAWEPKKICNAPRWTAIDGTQCRKPCKVDQTCDVDLLNICVCLVEGPTNGCQTNNAWQCSAWSVDPSCYFANCVVLSNCPNPATEDRCDWQLTTVICNPPTGPRTTCTSAPMP